MPLLLESGDYLLLENGDRLLLEDEEAGVSSTWIYNPPTRTVSYPLAKGSSFLVSAEVGRTVIQNGATYTVVDDPTTDTLAAATAYWRGGRDLVVTDAVKTALEAAGVGGTFTAVT